MVGRARFGKEIIAEFSAPRKKTSKVIIFCSGLPSSPSKRTLLEFFAEKGYWAFALRYRGTWESDGVFLKETPDKDVEIVMRGIKKGFKDLWSEKKFAIPSARVCVVGSSFGGTTALFALRNSDVTGAVALSPVVDWTKDSKTEPLKKMQNYIRDGFGPAYRVHPGAWGKLKSGLFFNPVREVKIYKRPLFIIHAQDDSIVAWRPVARFAKQCGAHTLMLTKGGHLSVNALMDSALYARVAKFLKTVYI